MPKPIEGGCRELVCKLKAYFDQEKRNNGPIIPVKKVIERVVAATGFSKRTILRMCKEGKDAERTNTKIVTPGKKRNRIKGKIAVNDCDLAVIRRTVQEFYVAKKEVPTIRKLLVVLRSEINFQGSREVLRKLLLKMGFRFKNTKTNRKVLSFDIGGLHGRNDISEIIPSDHLELTLHTVQDNIDDVPVLNCSN